MASTGEAILVRDSKDRLGPALTFTRPEWEAFLTGVRGGEFEPDRLVVAAPRAG